MQATSGSCRSPASNIGGGAGGGHGWIFCKEIPNRFSPPKRHNILNPSP